MIENKKREIINLTDVTYIYNQGNTFEKVALDNVNLKFYEHDFVSNCTYNLEYSNNGSSYRRFSS